MTVTLFGKGIFADVIQWSIFRWKDNPGFPRSTLNAITSVLIRENQGRFAHRHRHTHMHAHTQRRRWYEAGIEKEQRCSPWRWSRASTEGGPELGTWDCGWHPPSPGSPEPGNQKDPPLPGLLTTTQLFKVCSLGTYVSLQKEGRATISFPKSLLKALTVLFLYSQDTAPSIFLSMSVEDGVTAKRPANRKVGRPRASPAAWTAAPSPHPGLQPCLLVAIQISNLTQSERAYGWDNRWPTQITGHLKAHSIRGASQQSGVKIKRAPVLIWKECRGKVFGKKSQRVQGWQCMLYLF